MSHVNEYPAAIRALPDAEAYEALRSRLQALGNVVERRAAVVEGQQAQDVLEQLALAPAGDEAATRQWLDARQRQRNADARLLASLPVCPLSRCPYTGNLVTGRVDVYGTGSAWWRDEQTVREEFEGPATLFAVDGALRLSGTPEMSPWSVQPGPDKPFVIPAILLRGEMRAVLHQLPITGGDIWIITYFSYPMCGSIPRINDFARDCHTLALPTGGRVAYSEDWPESEMDFQLAPWIRAGKLLWIRPGDPDMRLHATVRDCPFLALAGTGRKQLLVNGMRKILGVLEASEARPPQVGLDGEMAAAFARGLALGEGEQAHE